MRKALVFALLLAACRCEGPPAEHTTPGGGAPEAALVQAMPDPFEAVGARGSLDPVERTARLLGEAGRPFGWGAKAAAGFRAHASEAWVKRVALLVDFGGTEQLNAAWLDLEDSLVSSARVSADEKLLLRQSEARIDEDTNAEVPEATMRRRLLAEIAWTFVRVGAGQPLGSVSTAAPSSATPGSDLDAGTPAAAAP